MRVFCFDMPTFNAYKVLLVAEELGVNYQLIKLDAMAGEHRQSAHMARHPLGKIPVLEDGERVLFESMAIVRYLMQLANHRIDGDDIHVSDQYAEFMIQHCGRAIATIYWQQVVMPKAGREADEDALASARKQLARELPVLEARLSAGAWIGGQSYSFADSVALAYTMALTESAESLDDWPSISKWQAGALERPATQRALAHYS